MFIHLIYIYNHDYEHFSILLCCYISNLDEFIHDVIGCSHQDPRLAKHGVALFSKTAPRQPGTVCVNNSCNMYTIYWLTQSVELRSKETAHGTCQWTKLNFILVSKQIQNGTLYKGNNDVGRGFIGCYVVFIMILPIHYAFSGPEHLLPVAWRYTIRRIFSCSNVLPTVPKGTI